MQEANRRYGEFFAALSDEGFRPYDYQNRVAEALWRRESLIIRAPTGSGKTKAVLAPFLYDRSRVGAARLIYALPLRSLAQGIYDEAINLAERSQSGCRVTIQTGEQPDDVFFAFGDIIITTYDQVLSGLLCAPYGLARKLRNINGAIAAGNLIVFDEFHLMEPQRAFITAVACLNLFGEATRSVWMTATATSPLTDVVRRVLGAAEVVLPEGEVRQLPSVSSVSRRVRREAERLTPEAVLAHADVRSLVIVNRVSRAQTLATGIKTLAAERALDIEVDVLHARFFSSDRKQKQQLLEACFGPKSNRAAILIATQVIEAGINISCDHLHTELCPMNSFVQRAGRCARFPGESGIVHAYSLPQNEASPYDWADLETAWEILPNSELELDPRTAAEWVEMAHRSGDEKAMQRYKAAARKTQCAERIWNSVTGKEQGGVADLIRAQTDSVRVAVCANPQGRNPGQMESVSLYRTQVRPLVSAGLWVFDPDSGWVLTREATAVDRTFAVAIPPTIARYTRELGLELGVPGTYESGPRRLPQRPGHRPLKREPWARHTSLVIVEALRRFERERSSYIRGAFKTEAGDTVRLAALLHDVGKLQAQWQEWAEAVQRMRDPAYVHTELLAHTDYDANGTNGMAVQISPSRPHHATASAYYGMLLLERLAPKSSPKQTMACIAAVLAHHGGWAEKSVLPLDKRWTDCLKAADASVDGLTLNSPTTAEVMGKLERDLENFCKLNFDVWWPLASYVTRTLRLSDQNATEEGSRDG